MSPFINTLLKTAGVFVLVLVIAAVIFPVFAKCRGCKDPRASCSSNEKQLYLAIIQYAQDNDETLPNTSDRTGGNTWRTAIYPYTKSQALYRCPVRDPNDHDANPVGVDGFTESYAVNDAGGRRRWHGAFAAPGAAPVKLDTVPAPQNLIALMETAYNPGADYDIDSTVQFSPASRRFWAGHQGLSNYLFLDGHVKALRPGDTDREANGKAIRNLWYRDETQPLSANGAAVLQDAQQRFQP